MVKFLDAETMNGPVGNVRAGFSPHKFAPATLMVGCLGIWREPTWYTTEISVPPPDRGKDKITLTGTKGEATGAEVFIDTNA